MTSTNFFQVRENTATTDARSARKRLTMVAAAALALAGCGSDGTDSAGATEDDAAPTSNACPPDGCAITFDDIEASGSELSITWIANFAPDFARNHIHIYWDIYDAAQVSADAEANGLDQGEWVPTDAYPTFVTEGAVSTEARGESTTLCVTTADRDHNVIDSAAVDCRDVSDLL